MNSILFRIDNSKKSGFGHLGRSASLIEQALKFGWNVHLFVDDQESLGIFLDVAKINVYVLPKGLSIIDDSLWCRERINVYEEIKIVVLDSYRHDFTWEKSWKKSKVVVIDDYFRGHDPDTYVLDYTRLDDGEAKHVSNSKTILGCPRLFLLRDEFHSSFIEKSPNNKTSELSILVSFGGADEERYGDIIVGHLINEVTVPINVTWVASPFNDTTSFKSKRLVTLSNSRHMAKLLSQHDIYIGAAGVTMIEAIALGLECYVWKIADNQDVNFQIAQSVNQVHCQYAPPSDFKLPIPESIPKSSQNCKSFQIDTLGARRAWTWIQTGFTSVDIDVLALEERWFGELFGLQSIPGVRKWFRNTSQPTWAEHLVWCENACSNMDTTAFVILIEGQVIGYASLKDLSDNHKEVSILCDPSYHGFGVMSKALNYLKRFSKDGTILVAEVVIENIRSRQLFLNSGFIQVSSNKYEYAVKESME